MLTNAKAYSFGKKLFGMILLCLEMPNLRKHFWITFLGANLKLAILKAKILLQPGLTCYSHICVKSKYPNLSWLSSEYHLAKRITTRWPPAAMVG